MTEITFPPEIVAQFAQVATSRLNAAIERQSDRDGSLRLLLDLNGYDPDDPAVWKAARKAAYRVADRECSEYAVMGKFYDITHMTNEKIGEIVGLPKSTVQAMACGRIPERYTHEQREAFKQLIVALAKDLRECLDALA